MIPGTGLNSKLCKDRWGSLVFLTILVLCFCVSSWGSCRSTSWYVSVSRGGGCNYGSYGDLPNCVSETGFTYTIPQACSMTSSATCSYNGCPGAGAYFAGASYAHDFCSNGGSSGPLTVYYCTTQAEADSLACLNNPDLPQCPHADTTYHCQNAGGAVAGGFGSPNIALIFQCIDDVCTKTQELAGTCQDWGYCEQGQGDCDITDSTEKKVPCALSGNGTSLNGKCYYSCGNGKNYTCSSKYSSWGGDAAGDVYIGQCDSYPSQTCAPDLYQADSTEQENPYTGGGAVPTDTSGIGDEIGSDETQSNLDYTKILEAIHDTLTMSLKQHRAQTWYQWSIDSVLKNNIYYDLEMLNNYQNSLNERDIEKFTLMQETGEDIRQARNLLDSIKNYDTLNVRLSDSLNINLNDTAILTRMDTIKNFLDSSTNGWQRLKDWYIEIVGDSASIAKRKSCVQYYEQCRSANEPLTCLHSHGCSMEDIVDGGTPWDAGFNLINSAIDAVLNKLTGGLFSSDSTDIPDGIDTTYTDTSGITQVQLLIDSLRNMEVPNINLDSFQAIVDSIRNDTTSIEVNPDSLVLDTNTIKNKFQQFYMPAGVNNSCYILRADLGNLGGLLDENLKLEVDFSNFGGYNFCDIGRSVIRIMTLVVCISLTLGSFAAAFGWNKNVGD